MPIEKYSDVWFAAQRRVPARPPVLSVKRAHMRGAGVSAGELALSRPLASRRTRWPAA
jgi:hypothetical protein